MPPVVNTTRAPTGQIHDRGGDLAGLVGNDAPFHHEALTPEQLGEGIAAAILAGPPMHAVGHRENGRLHAGAFVFSTSATPVIVIALSIALAMS